MNDQPNATEAPWAFEPATKRFAVSELLPLRIVTSDALASTKFLQILSSIEEVGLVELPVVTRAGSSSDTFVLLDGHMRIEALKQLRIETVDCIIATEDEAYTYNKRISRLATIQEHLMILKAIERGIPEARIAEVLNVDIQQIQAKRRLLRGICPEAAALLKDKVIPMYTFLELRRLMPVRQVEAAQLMLAMGKFSISYAKAIVAATPANQLVNPHRKQVARLSPEQMGLMESESASLNRELKLVEESYGVDYLDLVVARTYIAKLLNNAPLVGYLASKFPELLAEFQLIVGPVSRRQRGRGT